MLRMLASRLLITPVTASQPSISVDLNDAHARSLVMISGSKVRVTKSSLVMWSFLVPGTG